MGNRRLALAHGRAWWGQGQAAAVWPMGGGAVGQAEAWVQLEGSGAYERLRVRLGAGQWGTLRGSTQRSPFVGLKRGLRLRRAGLLTLTLGYTGNSAPNFARLTAK